MHVRSLPTLVGSALVALALVVTTAAPANADPVTDAGVDWLVDQQLPDGGFELASFAPFETPEAIVAIASAAQTGTTWSEAEALAAVEQVDGGDDDATPLDWADDFAEGLEPVDGSPGVAGGQAAKIIAFVAAPLGLDPTDFDPQGDSDDPVDLVQLLADDQPAVVEDPFGVPLFNSYLYATFADVVTGDPHGLLEERVAVIRQAQQPDGAWNFAGDPEFGSGDVDTTGYALTALVATGVPASDASVEAGLRFLATQHRDSGAWPSFGTDDVNSTATGLFGLLATGWDQESQCWRQVNAPGSGSRPYNPPADYVAAQQVQAPAADAGRFVSPNDGFGINTFATSQALQALFADQLGDAAWLPLDRASLQSLAPLDDLSDVPACAYYTRGVAWMAQEGITTGYEDGTFRPAAGMTRQAIAAQLYRFSGESFTPPAQATFPDVSVNHPFFEAIEWMSDAGLTTGYADGTFRPGAAVNRQQAAAFLHRIAGSPAVPAGAPSFPDVSASHPFVQPISWMASWRLTNPYPDGTFRPSLALNRGQLSTFTFRLASTAPAWGDVDLPPSVIFQS